MKKRNKNVHHEEKNSRGGVTPLQYSAVYPSNSRIFAYVDGRVFL